MNYGLVRRASVRDPAASRVDSTIHRRTAYSEPVSVDGVSKHASTQAVVAHEAGPDVIPEEAARIWVNTPVSAFGEFGAPRRGVKARPDALKQQAWVVRFAIHLHKLQTSDGADATRVAMKIMQEARDLQPEEATAIYAAEIPPPDDPGTPGD